MNVHVYLPSFKKSLCPAVSRCLSELERLTIDFDDEAEDIFLAFLDVAGIKVKCLVDLSDFIHGPAFSFEGRLSLMHYISKHHFKEIRQIWNPADPRCLEVALVRLQKAIGEYYWSKIPEQLGNKLKNAFPSKDIEACFDLENGQKFNILVKLSPDTTFIRHITKGKGAAWDCCQTVLLDVILEFDNASKFDPIKAPVIIRLRKTRELALAGFKEKQLKFDGEGRFNLYPC